MLYNQILVKHHYKVPRDYHEKNFEKFASSYPGYYTNEHGNDVHCENYKAFEVLYRKGLLDGTNRSAATKSNRSSKRKSTKDNSSGSGKALFGFGSNKHGETEKEPEDRED